MISVEVTCLATLGQQWRTAVHASVLGARVNPGSPLFAAVVRHLQETLTAAAGPLQAARIATAQAVQTLSQPFSMPAGFGHFTMAALFGTLGALVIAHRPRLSMSPLLNRGRP